MVQYISERRRKRARRAETDYRRRGWYFVTVVTRYRYPFFGKVVHGVEWLNAAGIGIEQTWIGLPEHHQSIRLNEFIVMPNHLHGIVVLDPTQSSTPSSLPDVLKTFKSLSTVRYSHGVAHHGWEPFESHLWQRSYHDQIIRDREHLAAVRTYITNNPTNWESDEEHPKLHPHPK